MPVIIGLLNYGFITMPYHSYLQAHVIIEFEAVLRFGALYYYDCIALNFNF